MNTQTMANRMEELMNAGMNLTEALTQVQSEMPKPVAKATGTRSVIPDRVSWIQELTRIDELRKAIKVAFAKKSKAKDKPDTEAKYQKEIDAGRGRLNELLAEVNMSETPWLKALELGDDVSGVLQLYLIHKETGLEEDVKALTPDMKVTVRKELLANQLTSTPWSVRADLLELGDEFLAQYEARAAKGDQRVLTISKRLNFIESATSVPHPAVAEPIDETLEEATETIEETQDEAPEEEMAETSNSKRKKNRN